MPELTTEERARLLAGLRARRDAAIDAGDVAGVSRLDAEIERQTSPVTRPPAAPSGASDLYQMVKLASIVLVLGASVILFSMAIGETTQEPQASAPLDLLGDIDQQVIADALRQYEIVSESGSNVDKCVQAGLVAAAYMQAGETEPYRRWAEVEDGWCGAHEASYGL
jgi:hypothetical protein